MTGQRPLNDHVERSVSARTPCLSWADGVPANLDRRSNIISELERAEVCAPACQLSAETEVPLARWSCPELAAELARRGLAGPISASSVRRILAEHPVKPWHYQSWIFPRDPDFAAKAAVVLDLYQGYYQGAPLGPGDRILSVDAKPSIQARARIHPTTPPASGQPPEPFRVPA